MKIETKRAFIINFLYCLIWAGGGIGFLKYGFHLVAPFLLAFLLASLIHRPARILSQKLHIHYKAIALILLMLFYGCIGTILSILGIRLAAGCSSLVDTLPTIYANHIEPVLSSGFNAVENHILHMDFSLFQHLETLEFQLLQSSGSLISELSIFIVEYFTRFAAALPGLLIKTLLMIISSFFIAIDYEHITGFCVQQLSEKAKDILYQVKNYVVNTLFVCIRSYLFIMIITFFELMLGLWLLGIERFVLIALLIAVFDILPVLGVGGILIPWGFFSILQGNYPLAIGLFALYLVILIIRNILEPKIVGKQIGLHPIVTLISMFIGARLLGILGLFGLPIGISLLQHLNSIRVIHIFNVQDDAPNAAIK